MYVRSQFSFQFFPAVIQLTVVASLHRADVFRVRLGGHCREFGVKPCSNVAYFSTLGRARAPFETEVSMTSLESAVQVAN